MSEEQDKARLLAERIAKSISHSESVSAPPSFSSNDTSALRTVLEDFNRRLVQIERQLANKDTRTNIQTANPSFKTHPSLDKFKIEEASDIAELVDFFESEKKCSLDPSGKPCDHCSMCSSRGF
jgi:hypothetical protein